MLSCCAVGRAVPTSAAHVDGVLNIVHQTLKKLLWMMPTSAAQLWPALADTFPHRTFPADTQRMYLTNCLHVADYCPALKERVILLIVDKLIQIDVCGLVSPRHSTLRIHSIRASWILAREPAVAMLLQRPPLHKSKLFSVGELYCR